MLNFLSVIIGHCTEGRISLQWHRPLNYFPASLSPPARFCCAQNTLRPFFYKVTSFIYKVTIFILDNPGKSWEIPGNPGKSWEIPGNPGKSWKVLGNPGKCWEILGDPGRSWKILGNPQRAWNILENLWKTSAKSWEILGNPGKYWEVIVLWINIQMRFQTEIGHIVALRFYHCSGFGCLLLQSYIFYTEMDTGEIFDTTSRRASCFAKRRKRVCERERKKDIQAFLACFVQILASVNSLQCKFQSQHRKLRSHNQTSRILRTICLCFFH